MGSNTQVEFMIGSHPPPHAGCPRGDPGPLAVLTQRCGLTTRWSRAGDKAQLSTSQSGLHARITIRLQHSCGLTRAFTRAASLPTSALLEPRRKRVPCASELRQWDAEQRIKIYKCCESHLNYQPPAIAPTT